MSNLRLGLWDVPKVTWAVLMWLEIADILHFRAVSCRFRDLASADMLWIAVAKSVLLVRHIMPRESPGDVMKFLANRTLCGESLHGTYTYTAAQDASNLLIRSAVLTLSHGRLGFSRPIVRFSLRVVFAANGVEDVCIGTMRYRLADRRFHAVTRRKGLRGWAPGPQFAVLAAPHRKPWMGESREHFDSVTPNGLRLILTVDRPGSWGPVFGCEINALIVVARKASDLAVDDAKPGSPTARPSSSPPPSSRRRH